MGDRRQGKETETQIDDGTVKYYITNLPEKCSGNDLDGVLRMFGEISKIYIARKRDRKGRRFGFITFQKIRDKDELDRSMRNLWMGSYKLRANIARFTDVEDHKSTSNKDNPISKEDKKDSGVRVPSEGTNSGTFREMLTGVKDDKKDDILVTIPDVINEFSDCHGKSLVARVFDIDALKKISTVVRELHPDGGVIQYLGGLSVLISFKDNVEAEEVRKKALERNDVFQSVEIWRGQSFPFERVAWLKVQGIPLNLLCNETLDSIGARFGKVIHKAKIQHDDGDLSYDYVGILVGDGRRIMEEIVLQWRRRRFHVWVMEEIGDWIPDFLFKKSEAVEGPSFKKEDDKSSEVDIGRKFGSGDFGIPTVFIPEKEEMVGPVHRKTDKKNKKACSKKAQQKMLSKDERPNALKRPRLDFDPNGLDPFGLDVILGINQHINNSAVLNNGSSLGMDVDTVKQRTQEGKPIDLNSQPEKSGDVGMNSKEVPEVQGSMQPNQNLEEMVTEEMAATVEMGFKLGAQLGVFQNLVRDTIVEEGKQAGSASEASGSQGAK